jgi:hypothetical protein
MLIVVTWLQTGPVIQTQALASAKECRAAAEASVQMIKAQAQTNMTSPHNQLTASRDEKTGEWTLATGLVGREVARVRCVNLDTNGR